MLNVSIFKKGKREASGIYTLVRPTSVKIIEKFILGVTVNCLRDNAVTGDDQHKRKVQLNQLNFIFHLQQGDPSS